LSDALRLVASFGLAMVAAAVFAPLAIRIAKRTGFMDIPVGYKGHSRATPYLGGFAVVSAAALAVIVLGTQNSRYGAVLIWAVVMFVVGTVDDRFNLNPLTRLVIEIVGGVALWNYGLGWAAFDSDAANIALTVLWVVGLTNAFNLMDNMDGATASVAGVSAASAAIAAIVGGDIALAVIVLAVAGACLGFLPFNLAKPSRIFLGDGGSMPLGFLVAGAVMSLPMSANLGSAAVLVSIPLVGLPILDTTLVVISRRRAGRPILSGGRDHLTHRLRAMLGGSTRAVIFTLATTQIVLCTTTIALAQVADLAAVLAAVGFVIAGAGAIYVLETPGRGRLIAFARAIPVDSAGAEKSAA
jgi:UDP-GlcNAc:undecaprenyl-phosphate GlcNAc-1-phosphate transferase